MSPQVPNYRIPRAGGEKRIKIETEREKYGPYLLEAKAKIKMLHKKDPKMAEESLIEYRKDLMKIATKNKDVTTEGVIETLKDINDAIALINEFLKKNMDVKKQKMGKDTNTTKDIFRENKIDVIE